MKLIAKRFVFVSRAYDKQAGIATFMYTVETENKSYHFTETLAMPVKSLTTEASDEAIEDCLNALHLVLGVSYWKAFCPPELVLQSQTLDRDQAMFWNSVYENGLGEFFYRNKIDFRGLIAFPYGEHSTYHAARSPVAQRGLLGLGGGKDSIVGAEMLKRINFPFSMFVVETQTEYPLIRKVAQQIGVDTYYIKRQIDPQLIELNTSGSVYNGHVPISAIYALVGYFLAQLLGYSYVIVPNEHSANVGNVDYLGKTVNHQWSKSYEFEKQLRSFIQSSLNGTISYISILRPLTELNIMSHLADYQQYLPIFSSCNTNFKLSTQGPAVSLWCGHCPKCAAVFIGMAAFMPLERVTQLFGKNLLEDAALIPLYRDLLGIGTMKPFECVGTFEENQAALYLILKKQEGLDTPIMKMFVADCLPRVTDPETLVHQQLTPDRSVDLPELFAGLFNLYEHSGTTQ